jgi:hypothetical protein
MRPLGVVLLAVLTAAPLVRTLCAWECGPADTAKVEAVPSEHSHCAQAPEGPPQVSHDAPDAETTALVSVAGCERCDIVDDTLRATVRTMAATPAPASIVPASSGRAGGLDTSDLIAAPPGRAAYPPLRAPYPLRI